MIDRVTFSEETDTDVAEAYNWYERCEPGLGEDFRREGINPRMSHRRFRRARFFR